MLNPGLKYPNQDLNQGGQAPSISPSRRDSFPFCRAQERPPVLNHRHPSCTSLPEDLVAAAGASAPDPRRLLHDQ